MLQLRPTCEHCARALPPASAEAMICSYECTFCRACARDVLQNVCPNCGGGFTPRPVRPARDWTGSTGLAHDPASDVVVEKPADLDAHAELVARVGGLEPEAR